MDRFFDANNPLMRALSRMVDLVILNMLTLFSCIPVVTVGASMTAMNYVLLHYVREEDSYTSKMFVESFKLNLKQGIKTGLIYVIIGILGAGDLLILKNVNSKSSTMLMIIFTVLLVVIFVHGIYAFALLSRYENSVAGTLINAFHLMIKHIFRTIGMIIVWVLWIACMVYLHKAAPVAIILYGVSLPGYMCTLLYNSLFEKLESQE